MAYEECLVCPWRSVTHFKQWHNSSLGLKHSHCVWNVLILFLKIKLCQDSENSRLVRHLAHVWLLGWLTSSGQQMNCSTNCTTLRTTNRLLGHLWFCNKLLQTSVGILFLSLFDINTVCHLVHQKPALFTLNQLHIYMYKKIIKDVMHINVLKNNTPDLWALWNIVYISVSPSRSIISFF